MRSGTLHYRWRCGGDGGADGGRTRRNSATRRSRDTDIPGHVCRVFSQDDAREENACSITVRDEITRVVTSAGANVTWLPGGLGRTRCRCLDTVRGLFRSTRAAVLFPFVYHRPTGLLLIPFPQHGPNALSTKIRARAFLRPTFTDRADAFGGATAWSPRGRAFRARTRTPVSSEETHRNNV